MRPLLESGSDDLILSQFPFNVLAHSTASRVTNIEPVSENEVNYAMSLERPADASGEVPKPVVLGIKARKIGDEWKLEPH